MLLLRRKCQTKIKEKEKTMVISIRASRYMDSGTISYLRTKPISTLLLLFKNKSHEKKDTNIIIRTFNTGR